jgi:4-amino-4-deoxy-L-arabinose transferase-like glycosyltransferase
VLAMWFCIRVYHDGRTSDYLFAGFFCGLAASTKYNGGVMLLAPLAAHFMREGLAGWRNWRVLAALGMAGTAFVLASPFALLDWEHFVNDLQFEARHYATGHDGFEGNSPGWYLTYAMEAEGPAALIALLEVGRGLLRRSKQTLLLAIFPITYFAFISTFEVRNARTLLPILPFAFLLAAQFLSGMMESLRTEREVGRPWHRMAVILLAVACVLWPLSQSVRVDAQFATVDSRETARVWIAEHLPYGARLCIESYAPYVDPRQYSIQGVRRMIDQPFEWYVANGCQYLIFSQGMYLRYYLEPERYAGEVGSYDSLFRTLSPVQVFNDGGYEVRIYRLPDG